MFIGIPEVFSRDYYLDATRGNDKHGGSRSHPWKTIVRANQVDLQPGDRLRFRAGQTFAGNLVLEENDAGTNRQPVIINSWGQGRARIAAGTGTGVLVQNAGGVSVQNLEIIGEGRDRNVGSGIRFENTRADGSQLEFVRINQVSCSGFGGITAIPCEEYGSFYRYGEGIFVGGLPWLKRKCGYRDVVIQSCETYDNESCGIYVTGPWDSKADGYANAEVRISQCRAHHNPGDPNFMNNHSGNGIFLEDTSGGVIDKCLAWENGALCQCPFAGPCGIWAAASTRITIQNCESWRNRTGKVDGDGLDFDGGVTDSIMQYNYVHENEGAGILLYSYAGSPHRFARNVCRFNLCVYNGRKNDYGEISIGNSGGAWDSLDVYHNTGIADGTSDTHSALHIMNGNTPNIRLFNNLLICRENASLIRAASQPGFIFSGNALGSEDGKLRIDFDGKNYSRIQDWQIAVGPDICLNQDFSIHLNANPILPDKAPTVADSKRLSPLRIFQFKKNLRSYPIGVDLTAEPLKFNLGNRDFFGNSLHFRTQGGWFGY